MKKNQFRLPAVIVLTALSVTILTGCSAEKSSEVPASYYSDTGSDYAAYDRQSSPTMEAEATVAADTGPLIVNDTIQPVQTNRKLIRNANLTMETTAFNLLLEAINNTVTGLGGYVEQSDVSGNSISASAYNRRYAYLTVRIPADKLDQFITQIGDQGNITNKSESIQDVTLQYSDIESRKKSLTIEQERLWALLEKADTLEAVIALEARLSEIRYQLESFESQLRLYDNQVDYSTVTLNISEVQVFTPTAPDSVSTRIQKGFTRNLNSVSSTSLNFFIWFISSIPSLLVLGVIAGLITWIARKLISHKKKKQEDSEKHKNRSRLSKIKPAATTIPETEPSENPSSSEPETPTEDSH